MADPIVIQLQARGVQELQATFRSVEQTIIGFERNVATAGERGARTRVQVAQREGSDRDKAYAKLFDEAEKRERKGVAATEKAAKEKAKAAERGEAEQVRAVEKAEQEKQRAIDKTARWRQRVQDQSAAMAGASAVREVDKRIAEEKRLYDARVRFARNVGGMITGSIGGAMQGIVGAGRGLVSGALQVGGGFSIADSVSREMKLTGQAATLAASSQADSDGKKWKTAEILRSARGTANALSMDPEEVMKGIGKYKDLTGNLGDAIRLSPQMAKLATALGADTGELMENAGNAANAGLKGDDIMRMARVQTMQGMQGAVELKDMAKYGARLTAGAGLYGGDRATNIATMGAFAQIARQHGGASSAAEATLAAQRFTTDVQKHSKHLESQGIKVGDGHGGLRDGREIIKDMLVKSGGDVTKFGQFGLGERGVRVLTGASDIYRQASGGTRQQGESDASFKARSAAGMAAVDAELGKYTKGVSDKDIDAAAKERLGEADKQVTKAMNELRDAVGTQLLPEFIKLVPVLTELMPTIRKVLTEVTKFANWFAANPIKGIGAVVLAKVVADLGQAAIGEGVKQVLMRLIAGAAPGGAGSAAGSAGLLGKVGAGSAAAGGAVVAGGLVQAGLLYKLGSDTGGAVMSGKEQGENIAAMLKSADPSKRAEGQKLLDAAKKDAGIGAKTGAVLERGGKFGAALINPVGALVAAGVESGIGSVTGGKTGAERSLKAIEANEIVNTVELRKQIATAVVGGVADGMASKAGTPASANSPSTTQPLSARP
jgi:hypothetical protein